MSDLAALLSACRADPADDLPRLVLADWLDEHGEADRALFIRVQCELARPTADAARAADLRAVERDLLEANGRAWLGDLPAIRRGLGGIRRHDAPNQARAGRGRGPVGRPPRPPFRDDLPWSFGEDWQFARGLLTVRAQFVDLAHEPLREWLRSPAADWVEVVQIGLVGLDALERLTPPPELAGRLGVDVILGEPVDIAGWERFVAGPTFAALRMLFLYPPAAAAAGHLRALAAADSRITVLDPSHIWPTDAGRGPVPVGSRAGS